MIEKIKQFFQKHKKLILIILALVLILFIVIFSIPRKKQEETVTTSTIRGTDIAEQPTIVKGELTIKDKEISNVSIVARNFVEIYGSYSNQSNYINIESVLPLVSISYKNELQSLLKTNRANYKPGEVYEGVTTVVLNNVTEYLDETKGTATLLVKTQKKESQETQANYKISYQDIRVSLVKESGAWKVSSAKWIE
ncbi:MAG: hypothetical protein COU51_01090 [Parcubacteria group bacterium CG10_big_fil_rev_8_21_14_0_10_36_14]|nr:MAG: hypothetical protein COU51_01090 [Parcubacteria group bacterium CG10_big_fil_rev_8_21_14_0_10_36_14]